MRGDALAITHNGMTGERSYHNTLAHSDGPYVQIHCKTSWNYIHPERSRNGSKMRRFTTHCHTSDFQSRSQLDECRAKQAPKSSDWDAIHRQREQTNTVYRFLFSIDYIYTCSLCHREICFRRHLIYSGLGEIGLASLEASEIMMQSNVVVLRSENAVYCLLIGLWVMCLQTGDS